MEKIKRIKSALISVYHKENLDGIIKGLVANNIEIYSTGGTKDYIQGLNVAVRSVEEVTTYPSILGGRVKTLHPKIFGGILARRNMEKDNQQLAEYTIPEIDLVIVDLYPFEETVNSASAQDEIIEKIDIGGIALIRAAAKNYEDVLVISSQKQYAELYNILETRKAETNILDRKRFAAEAFNVSSHYDTLIYKYLSNDSVSYFKESFLKSKNLRYGENPHQKGKFFGDFNQYFEQLSGKEISFNNILDIDAAVKLIADFDDPTFAILKHNNACGLASNQSLLKAWQLALASDPISAFGGVVITNQHLDKETAASINSLFFEIIIAPSYEPQALDILKQKKNRIILIQKDVIKSDTQFRTALNGILLQDTDNTTETKEDLRLVTNTDADQLLKEDLLFANKIVKHSKSNAIVIAKNKQLLASGVGETSRVDALKHAIDKAKHFNFELKDAVLASDAFFPFSDSIEIACTEGIKTIVQPGGSIKDNEVIEFCNANNVAMFFTGIRHFKH